MQTSFYTSAPHMPLPAADPQAPYFFDSEKAGPLPALLKKPYNHFVEIGEYVHLGQVLHFVRNEYPHMSLSLTSKTAFRQPVAEFFINHIAQSQDITGELVSHIKTCLQEAVMNSIIHGNLQVEHDTNEDFYRYLEGISARLTDETLACRRVSIFAWFTEKHITLAVCDQGKGFDLNQPRYDLARPYGRGLMLIRQLSGGAWQPRPNHLYLQFARHG